MRFAPTHHGFIALDPGRDTGFSVFVRDATDTSRFAFIGCGMVHSGASTHGAIAVDIGTTLRREIAGIYWRAGSPMNAPGRSIGVGVELMEFRPEDVRSNPEDLIQVATVGAYCAGMLSRGDGAVLFTRPSEWKGNVPKDIHARRMIAALSVPEVTCMERDLTTVPKSLRHNVTDAIALGLYFAGRIRRGGVLPNQQ